MKKVFSILFALLILLSGMHLSIATHFCGGEIADVKWSFTSEKATCGMEEDDLGYYVNHKTIESNCCQNEISIYAVDSNYSPSSFQIQEITKNIIQEFYIPENISFNSYSYSNYLYADVSPPGNLLTSAVGLDDICIFRI